MTENANADMSSFESSMGELEGIASGMQSSSGISLNASVRKFIESNVRARNAQTSAAEAESNAANLTYNLYAHLRKDGFECSILTCKGFKSKLVDCSPDMEAAIRELGSRLIAQDLIHFVVQVGNIVLDLGFRRLGSEYMHSNNTVINQFKHHWNIITEMAARHAASHVSFLHAARAALSMTNLKKIQNKLESKADFGSDFAATAGAVATAFASPKLKRNRRQRFIATAGDGVSRIRLRATASSEDRKEQFMRQLMGFRGMFDNTQAPSEGMMAVVAAYADALQPVLAGTNFDDLTSAEQEKTLGDLEGAALSSFGNCARPSSPNRAQEAGLQLYDHLLTHEKVLGNIPVAESSEISVDDLQYFMRRFFPLIGLASLLFSNNVRSAHNRYAQLKDSYGDLIPSNLLRTAN